MAIHDLAGPRIVPGELRAAAGPGHRPAVVASLPAHTLDSESSLIAFRPEHLGDPSFLIDHGLRYPYLAGAMANGIGSVEIVEAMGRAGMLGFFGAAGLSLERIERAIDRLQGSLGASPFGFNLIHSPTEPGVEQAVVDLSL